MKIKVLVSISYSVGMKQNQSGDNIQNQGAQSFVHGAPQFKKYSQVIDCNTFTCTQTKCD